MEIINCFDSYSTTRVSARAFGGREFREIYSDFKGKILYGMRNVGVALKYAWILPVAALCVAIPFGVSRLLSFSDSFARRVEFDSSYEVEKNFVDAAMVEFANDKLSFFDIDGNVLGSDGIKIESAVSFKDPVTFTTYTVQAGDTVGGISSKFGLSTISTLVAVNSISNVRNLYTGQKLVVPSVDGLVHEISKDESLASISAKYNVTVADLVDVNDLSSDVLNVGQKLFIPGARMDGEKLKRAMGEVFIKPIKIRYRLTSFFGPREDPISHLPSRHSGIDMACPTGTPIYASMSGTVTKTGFSSIYGNYVIINHIEGYQTLYAHMSKILCSKGDKVGQSTRIGLVGNTGYSTGPHLHFSVYKNSNLVDPQSVMK